MTYVVTAGYVTVQTAVPGGRAEVDIPRGQQLPDDVPAEQRETLLRFGHIVPSDDAPETGEPDTDPAVDDQGDRLAALKAEAERLGVQLHHSMKLETIERKVTEAREAAAAQGQGDQ